jgi:hypothetical protein
MKTIFSPSERPGLLHHVPQEWRPRSYPRKLCVNAGDRTGQIEITYQVWTAEPFGVPFSGHSIRPEYPGLKALGYDLQPLRGKDRSSRRMDREDAIPPGAPFAICYPLFVIPGELKASPARPGFPLPQTL